MNLLRIFRSKISKCLDHVGKKDTDHSSQLVFYSEYESNFFFNHYQTPCITFFWYFSGGSCDNLVVQYTVDKKDLNGWDFHGKLNITAPSNISSYELKFKTDTPLTNIQVTHDDIISNVLFDKQNLSSGMERCIQREENPSQSLIKHGLWGRMLESFLI